ncbi:hypothetical protein D1872_99140 [compost metagenome]
MRYMDSIEKYCLPSSYVDFHTTLFTTDGSKLNPDDLQNISICRRQDAHTPHILISF